MQITQHVHALKVPFQITVNPEIRIDRFVYVYLIYGAKIYLIDSAVAPAKDMIFDYIEKTGRSPSEIELLLLTHSHPDHIGAACHIKERSGCKVAAHAAERHWIEDCTLQAKERPIPGFHFLVEGSVQVDMLINDDDVIRLDDDLCLNAYHTPGHSIGSLSFYLPADKALFSGDVIPLKGDIPIYEDVNAIKNSINRLQAIDDVAVLFSSWADPRQADEVVQEFNDSLEYIHEIDQLVLEKKDIFIKEPLKTCKEILFELGVPISAANSLVLRSLMSHIHN
ncbi:MAG: MBL fold metallo-hydrolase [Candidatus Omnitrophica bacterium]|nr:MBL fold metallo-hydrolase [Candidatus Omnitrophota bacterium]